MKKNGSSTSSTTIRPEVNEHVAHRLIDLMKDFRVAMLVTQELAPAFSDPTNSALHSQLRARPMAIAEVSASNTICFSTSMTSAKIEEIRKHPDVLVTMQSATSYVSIGGRCVLSQDPAEISRLWNESWRIWFPTGKDDPELVLIRVPVETGEFWDLQGTKGIRFLWQATMAYFSGEKVADVPDVHGALASNV